MEDYKFLFKVVLVGNAGVGKTCLVRRFTQGLFPPGQGATIGVDFMIKTVEVDNERVKVCMISFIFYWFYSHFIYWSISDVIGNILSILKHIQILFILSKNPGGPISQKPMSAIVSWYVHFGIPYDVNIINLTFVKKIRFNAIKMLLNI